MAPESTEATPLPSVQGLLQRTAGSQVSASRLFRQGEDTDVELGQLADEEPSPGMLGEQLLRRPDCCGLSYKACSARVSRGGRRGTLGTAEIAWVPADAFTPHSSRLSSDLRPLASVPLLQHAPAPAASAAAHLDRLTSSSIRWLQVQPPAY